MKKGLTFMAAALLLAACMTPGQKRAKADAESAVSQASASIAAARQAGGDTYDSSQLRSAENDLRAAQNKLKSGDWDDATRRARFATSSAGDAREAALAAQKREKSSTAAKADAFKPGSSKKKQQSKPTIAK